MFKNLTSNIIDPLAEKSNEEISDLIRDWLTQNAGNIVLVIGLAIAMSVGYQWYQGRGDEQRSQASHQLDKLQSALVVNQETGKVDLEQARGLNAALQQSAPTGALRDLSALLLATQETDAAAAKALLEQASRSQDEMVAALALRQLAVNELAAGNHQNATAYLEQMRGGVLNGQVAILQAYVAQAKGDYQSALQIYNSVPEGERDVLAEMVINDLEARALLAK